VLISSTRIVAATPGPFFDCGQRTTESEGRDMELARPASAMGSTPEALLEPLQHIAVTGAMPSIDWTARVATRAHDVLEIKPARLYELLTPSICSRYPHVALQWLREAQVLQLIMPELDATVNFSQEAGRRHKDVWEHTKQVVRQAVPRPIVRWAAVLHDIGKVTTRRFLPDGKVTFHGHSEEGVRMFRRGASKRIGFPTEVREPVEELIRHHLRPGQYESDWTDSAVRRFHRDMEPILKDLLDLGRADITSKRPGKRMRSLQMIHELCERIDRLAVQDAQQKPLPPGLGNTLMQALDLPPGKHIGELRQRLEALFDAGEIEGGGDVDYYLDIVRKRDLMKGIIIRTPRGF
jgi:poly(A) polymerase